MDLEQIIKRLEWLDDERRKDKTTIATLEKRFDALEGKLPAVQQELKELNGEVARVATFLQKFEEIETSISRVNVELSRKLDGIEKQRADHEREADKVRREDIESLQRAIAEVRKTTEPMPELKAKINARQEEEYRLARLIDELDQKFTENVHADEEYRRAQKLLEEGRRQDVKRLADLQTEVSVFRKRLDEQRGKVELASDGVRKLELRIGDVQAAETERRQVQNTFVEKQSMAELERTRQWQEWQTQFEEVSKQAVNLDAQIQALDATHRSVKRAVETIEDTKQRFERRLNEITEMQRLVEERFRQEWVSFKADDQKRWTNYTLAQDERQKEASRRLDKQDAQVVELNDLTQEIQDTVDQITAELQKILQSMLSTAHDMVENYNDSFGTKA